MLIHADLVRDERALVECPQQVIECLRVGQRVVDDDDAQIPQIGFFGQPAGERPALLGCGAFQYVEIYALGHVARTRLTRNSTSQGTGRPVLPLWAPPSQAVPATSRCAHCRSLANFERNEAAVQAPPSRPPTLAISAKLLFNWSTYSSPIGNRQA